MYGKPDSEKNTCLYKPCSYATICMNNQHWERGDEFVSYVPCIIGE